jgi:hypothetical protein
MVMVEQKLLPSPSPSAADSRDRIDQIGRHTQQTPRSEGPSNHRILSASRRFPAESNLDTKNIDSIRLNFDPIQSNPVQSSPIEATSKSLRRRIVSSHPSI